MSLHYSPPPQKKKVTTDLKECGEVLLLLLFFVGVGGGVFPEFQSNLVRFLINTGTLFGLRRLFTLSAT